MQGYTGVLCIIISKILHRVISIVTAVTNIVGKKATGSSHKKEQKGTLRNMISM